MISSSDLFIPLLLVAGLAWAVGRLQAFGDGWTQSMESWKKNVEPSVRRAGYSAGYHRATLGLPPEYGDTSSKVLQ